MSLLSQTVYFSPSSAFVSGVTPIRRATSCPDGSPICWLRMRLRTDKRLSLILVRQRCRRERVQRRRKPSIHLPRALCGLIDGISEFSGVVEEPPPLDLQPCRDRASTIQPVVVGHRLNRNRRRISEQRNCANLLALPIAHSIAWPRDTVSEAEGRHGKLHRNKCSIFLILRPVIFHRNDGWLACNIPVDLPEYVVADNTWQEVVRPPSTGSASASAAAPTQIPPRMARGSSEHNLPSGCGASSSQCAAEQ